MRPILLGMQNPHNTKPGFALYPAPRGCTGHRLWQMLHEVSGCRPLQYVQSFDRRNLVTGPWSREAARVAVRTFIPPPAGGTVVVLGQEVARALGLETAPFSRFVVEGTTWITVPHPSGRNPWYAEPAHRLAVGLLLEELLCVQ
jgi:hypothetical protein